MIQLPLIMRSTIGKEEIYITKVYVIEADVAFLCGKKTIEQLDSKLETVNSLLETNMNRNPKDFEMNTTSTGHYGVRLKWH